MSVALEAFRRGFFQADTYALRKDGPPLELIDALDGADRLQAEEELLLRLDGRDDWIAQGLGRLRSQRAVPVLRKHLFWGKCGSRATYATAIYLITGDTSMEYWVAREARAWNPFSFDIITYEKIHAIHHLAVFKTPSAVKVLDELCHDSDYLVSDNAKRVLGRPTR
jgi:hypothetical protein